MTDNGKRKGSVGNGLLILWLLALGVWCAFTGHMWQYLIGTGAGLGTLLLVELAVKLFKRGEK